jgi:hypothetical protein
VGLLFSRHSPALQISFAEIKRHASEQDALFVGTPGSVSVREVKGRSFYYRQFYDASGRKAADYIGPVGDAAAEVRAKALRQRIEATAEIARDVRLLAQQGYVRADPRTVAVLGAIANHGLFRAGAILVGSHAYGALLNALGVRAGAFATEDVDIARATALELAGGETFEQILALSTVRLVPVPPLGRKGHVTSYKAPGSDRLRVDLLAPARGATVSTVAVPELQTHAAALPYLAYLLDEPVEAVVLGRDSAVPVLVPRSERFAWHKMIVSQSRSDTSEKRRKDIEQASVVVAVLAEDAPAALAAAWERVPRSARSRANEGARAVLARLEATKDERAVDVLRELLGR